MAAITASNVVDIESYDVGTRSGKLVALVRRVAITLSSQGGTAGDIPASVLGFGEIFSAQAQVLDVSGTPKGALVMVAKDGSELIPIDLNQATDANRTARANITGVLYVTVTGRGL
jgi:hypothetical protein